MASSDMLSDFSLKSKSLMNKINTQCDQYLQSELNSRLLSSTDMSSASEHYLAEYQRCIDEKTNLMKYIDEQMTFLESLKLCDTSLNTFLQRLRTTHDFELKQNEIFERILHELTKLNPSSQDERLRLIGQIDDLIADKTNIIGSTTEKNSSANKLAPKSSDTFKNIL